MMSEEALDLSSDLNNNTKPIAIDSATSTLLNNSANNVVSVAAATMAAVSMLKLDQQKDLSILCNNNDNNGLLLESINTSLLQNITDNNNNRQNNQLQTALATLLSPGSVISPWLSTKSALGSILQQLPVPSTSLVNSFSALHSLYASIHTTCLSLDKLLEQYFVLFVSAFLKSQHDKNNNFIATTNSNTSNCINTTSNNGCTSSTSSTVVSGQSSPPFLINNVSPTLNYANINNCHKRKSLSPICSLKPSKSPLLSNEQILDPISSNITEESSLSSFLTSPTSNGSVIPSSRLFKRKKLLQSNNSTNTNNNLNKKSNFRGTSEAENEIDPSFHPREINREIVLCDEYPSVRLDRDVYSTLTSKAPRSATRLIRLLMKHFFSQEVLARSSLSGEGIYKDRLQPEVIEAIKLYIKRRHPKLKNGSINLCMTDVCVQARRVNKNQRTRIPDTVTTATTTTATATSSSYDDPPILIGTTIASSSPLSSIHTNLDESPITTNLIISEPPLPPVSSTTTSTTNMLISTV